MKKIKLFLASSNELKPERERFEIEIYRKCKAWWDRGIFLHLDIWEDLSARMSLEGSQSEYNKFVQAADIFVLLAYTKVGMYTAEEFEKAFGQFQSTRKPFIFTYFKICPKLLIIAWRNSTKTIRFHHFYSPFMDANDLWNQFNKELERLETKEFKEFLQPEGQSNRTIIQNAEKIYNIDRIDNADFS
ncbi:MAG: hypothetical protein IPJ74_19110 [Saprospiraceae bacterium]|nr:hypothetical protein [Saprospiraceae bacterium]